MEKGIVRDSNTWGLAARCLAAQSPAAPAPTTATANGEEVMMKTDCKICKTVHFSSFSFLILFSLLLWQSANAQKRANHSPVIIVKLQNKQTCWNRNYSMKATHIYIQERQKPFRYFCDDPVQETCKQFDFLKQPYLYLSFPIIMTRL